MEEPTGTPYVESITAGDEKLAIVVRAALMPETTTFLTAPENKLQLGFVAYPKDGKIDAHTHKPVERSIQGTDEVLMVKKGRCRIDFYDSTKELVASRDLDTGDIVLLTSGGHGFTMLEDCILIEVKQGPYFGLEEKERF